jgi:hypothetical protein
MFDTLDFKNSDGRGELNLWTKIRLLFKKEQHTMDRDGNITTVVTYKMLDNKVFIIDWGQRYKCDQCKDTGEIWAGLSGCDIYECECKKITYKHKGD